MQVSSVPSLLLLGLSARIFIDKFILSREPSMRDFGLLGLWQGVALYYAFTVNQQLAAMTSFFIGAKLLFEFSSEQDTVKFITTVLAAVLGVFGTDLLSRYIGDGLYHKRKSKSHSHGSPPDKKHLRSAHSNKTAAAAGEGRARIHQTTSRLSPSDITSIDASSDVFHSSSSSMSPREREVARLRTRASLADTERRRCKEERKWAISQGNHVLASQLAWEVKRYKALMQSFHREADALITQASNPRRNGTEATRSPVSDRNPRPNGNPVANPPAAVNGTSTSHKGQKSGTTTTTKPAARARW